MTKKYLLLCLLVLAAAGGLIIGTHHPKKAVAPATQKNDQVVITATHHVIGKANAKVTMVEYGDYQCPACGAYYPIVKATQEKYTDQISFQFRNYPLTQIHLNALAGALTAEAAGKQGKYWEMHDKLYETQETWVNQVKPLSTFEGYAKDLGLNVAQFDQDYNDPNTKAEINADVEAGSKLKIDHTPTFYLNGKMIESQPTSVEDFSALIDPLLVK